MHQQPKFNYHQSTKKLSSGPIRMYLVPNIALCISLSKSISSNKSPVQIIFLLSGKKKIKPIICNGFFSFPNFIISAWINFKNETLQKEKISLILLFALISIATQAYAVKQLIRKVNKCITLQNQKKSQQREEKNIWKWKNKKIIVKIRRTKRKMKEISTPHRHNFFFSLLFPHNLPSSYTSFSFLLSSHFPLAFKYYAVCSFRRLASSVFFLSNLFTKCLFYLILLSHWLSGIFLFSFFLAILFRIYYICCYYCYCCL